MAYIITFPTASSDRVSRFYKTGHTYRVGSVLYRSGNDQTWSLASLTDLTKFDSWIVTAIGTDWFEVPNARGAINIPSHGFGPDGALLFLDWRVDGQITTDAPTQGNRRFILGKIINASTIDYCPENSYVTVP